jgi:hypothetical protein
MDVEETGGPVSERAVAQLAMVVPSPAVRGACGVELTAVITTAGQRGPHRGYRVGGNRVAAAREEQAEEQGADEESRPGERHRSAAHGNRPISRARRPVELPAGRRDGGNTQAKGGWIRKDSAHETSRRFRHRHQLTSRSVISP